MTAVRSGTTVGFRAPPPAVPSPPSPAPTSTSRRLALGSLVVATVIWAAAGIAALTRVGPFAPSGAPRPQTVPSAGVGGFAEAFVATLLGTAGEGREDVLAPYLAGTVDLTGVRPGTWFVNRTATTGVESLPGGVWRVTVAADLLGAVQGGFRPAGTHWYQVLVVERGGRLAVSALPAEVSPPAAPGPADPVPAAGPAAEPVAQAVTGFVRAYLTGAGALADHVSGPDAPAAFPQPPYRDVSIRRVTSDDPGAVRQVVRVDLLAVDGAGRRVPLSYALDMGQRDGAWRVLRISAGTT